MCRLFDPESLHRMQDAENPAVTLLMGKRRIDNEDLVISVLFDRSEFTEDQARNWWSMNEIKYKF